MGDVGEDPPGVGHGVSGIEEILHFPLRHEIGKPGANREAPQRLQPIVRQTARPSGIPKKSRAIRARMPSGLRLRGPSLRAMSITCQLISPRRLVRWWKWRSSDDLLLSGTVRSSPFTKLVSTEKWTVTYGIDFKGLRWRRRIERIGDARGHSRRSCTSPGRRCAGARAPAIMKLELTPRRLAFSASALVP